VALERCNNGHFFDPGKHTTCPHCGVAGLDFPHTDPAPVSVVAPLRGSTGSEESTQGKDSWQAEGDPVTKAVIDDGIDPAVGWLVCVEGPDRGQDYRIREGNNSIGRSPEMYICISNDDTVSRQRHAVVTFEPQQCHFYLAPGEARGLAYVNDEPLLSPRLLQAYDAITLGKTKLLFIPLCGENFQWREEKAQSAQA
jgi:hypothetical protein